jgi:hypothetical protein
MVPRYLKHIPDWKTEYIYIKFLSVCVKLSVHIGYRNGTEY